MKHSVAFEQADTTIKDSQINHTKLNLIIEKAVKKLAEDKCFLSDHRQLLSTFKITTNESLVIWEEFSPILSKFNGNAEKFYSEFYKFCLPSKHVFIKLPRQLSALLCSEIANLCLRELCNETENEVDFHVEVDLTEKDKDCIKYLAGYCFRTLYTRIRSSRLWQSDNSQQCLSLLVAAKCDDEQSLVDVKNRGGLWKVCDKAQSIFCRCEKEFKIFTTDFQSTIDSKLLLAKILKDGSVNNDFKYISESADRKVDKEVAKNLLENLVLLYIRVRSHSYAKKLKESHKVYKKASKKRSLRTELKLSTSSTEHGH